MELHHLRSFAAIARHGRLGEAARALRLSPSALSAHLKELESELGQELFVRSATGMAITGAGRALHPRAEAALAAVDSIVAGSADAALSGELDVGTIADAAWLRVPQALEILHHRHPGLALRFHQGISGRVQADIAAGRLRAGWSLGAVGDPRLASRVLAPVALRVVGPPAWAARLRQADRAALAAFPWIATPAECPYTAIVAALLAPHPPRCPAQADMEASLRGLAAAGVALTLLREEVALVAEARGELAVWPGAVPASELRFVVAAGSDPTLAALMEAVVAAWKGPARSPSSALDPRPDAL